jgi:hypothetical protein
MSPLRQKWTDEERMLMRHYVELGDLQAKIQFNWYGGAAQLAAMKMKLEALRRDRGIPARTQRNGKPTFREHPTVEAE